MSNYPPGVTGNEDHLTGPRGSIRAFRACETEIDRIGTVIVLCPFEGEVDLDVWGDRVSWNCPTCDEPHDDDLYSVDPDEEY